MDPDPRVVVTGAGGQVGRALARLHGARFLSRQQLDVTDRDAVMRSLAGAQTVVHLAAWTDVDGCEREPARARLINAEGTRNVVDAAAEHGARTVYVSTDYVFDGRRPGEYSEDDSTAPLNAYGRTKLEGERHVADAGPNLIVRTSWVFGDGRNFVRSILTAARSGRSLRVVDDQRGRPTSAGDLAAALEYLLGTGAEGIVHVAGDGPPCTWAELATTALGTAGLAASVEPIDSAGYAREAGRSIAERPANSVLALDRARRAGVPLFDWRTSLERYVRRFS